MPKRQLLEVYRSNFTATRCNGGLLEAEMVIGWTETIVEDRPRRAIKSPREASPSTLLALREPDATVFNKAPVRGQRAYAKVPRNRGPNTTLLSSMGVEGIGPSLAVEGSINREVLETYVERVLAATLRPGQIVLMDNLTAHKGKREKRDHREARGRTLLYLPPYSPDFNPIEEAFSKVKGVLRRAEACTREALIEAMGAALSSVSAQGASGFFRHCGYRVTVQLL